MIRKKQIQKIDFNIPYKQAVLPVKGVRLEREAWLNLFWSGGAGGKRGGKDLWGTIFHFVDLILKNIQRNILRIIGL